MGNPSVNIQDKKTEYKLKRTLYEDVVKAIKEGKDNESRTLEAVTRFINDEADEEDIEIIKGLAASAAQMMLVTSIGLQAAIPYLEADMWEAGAELASDGILDLDAVYKDNT